MARGIVKGGLNDGGSNVKSIQRGEASLVNDYSVVVTISTIDTSKSIVIFSVAPGATNNAVSKDAIRAVITSATQITFTVNTISTLAASISWQVIEFNNVKSKQSGVVTVDVNPKDVTITAVDLNKTMVFVSSTTNSATSNAVYVLVKHTLTSSTNLRFSTLGYGSAIDVAWQVIEFN